MLEKLLQMNPFPAEHLVLVLDNCQIHHNEALIELVMSAGELCWFLCRAFHTYTTGQEFGYHTHTHGYCTLKVMVSYKTHGLLVDFTLSHGSCWS